MRFFIYLQYDGSAYHGWQVQPGAISVQQKLNEALSTILGIDIEVVGAGRTDAGVNASLMVAHFDIPEEAMNTPRIALEDVLSEGGLRYRLNKFLPADIAITDIVRVNADAHARFSATSRTYHYYVTTGKSPFLRHYAMRLPYAVDFGAMNKAAKHLLDIEDFTSFSKLHTDTKTNICHVTEARWTQEENGQWCFTITADRFLRNMVRAVVGTLLDVGRGRITEEQFLDIIHAKNRCAAGESVMGEALFLADIGYPQELFVIK